jgi:DNA polymerase-3 subunit gamma/tau
MTGDAPSPGQGPGHADKPRQSAPAAPLALYRRYRPATFAEVKGQDHVTEPLRQALRSGRVNHAYLFSGPRGCGKTSSARILARSLNCESGPTPDPCGVCASCVALAPAGPGSIDVIEIDAASHGGVDDARDLRERAFYAPVSGRFKIYIIDEAHMVTREGFNALLKLVEEPPPHLKFVFATTEPEKVIATIRSRTHHYPFRLVPPAVLRELLEGILASEGTAYEPAVIPVVIRAGAGSVRDSLSVLDQLIAGSDDSGLSYDRAIALLGYTDDRLLDEVAQAFAARDGAAIFGAIDRVVEGGHDPRRFAADLLDRLRDLIVLAAVPDAVSTGLLDVPADRVEGMRAQAEAFGQSELTRAAEIISAGLVEMRGATSPRLLLELMCAQVLLPAPGVGDADLRGRLERLERRLESVASAGGTARPASQAPVPPAPAQAPARAASAPTAPSALSARSVPPAQAPVAPPPAAADRPEPARPRDDEPDAPPEPAASSAAPPSGQVDADLLRSRWPDVLESVRQERKVAWMLLANASVESLTDGALTIEFAREGDAKGFTNGGHDNLLSEVLQSMFGISPKLRATARTPGGPGGTRGAGGARGSGRSGGPGSGDPGSGGSGSGGSGGATTNGPGSSGPGGAGPGGAGPGGTGSGSAASGSTASGSTASGGARPGTSASAGTGSGGTGTAGTGSAGMGSGGAGAGGTGAGGTGGPGSHGTARGSSPASGRAGGRGRAGASPDDASGRAGGPGRAGGNEPPAAWDEAPPVWEAPPETWDDPRDEEDYEAGPPGPLVTPGSGPGGRPQGGTQFGGARHPAPGPMSGMELIERELGGRIIEGLGDAEPAGR